MSDHKAEAQAKARAYLQCLRIGTSNYREYIFVIHEEARMSRFSLEDIGTSEKELWELRIKGCKIAAQQWLGQLRSGTRHYDLLIYNLREELRKGRFSLDDIGTCGEELRQLRIKGCKIAAHEYLRQLRSGTRDYDLYIRGIYNELINSDNSNGSLSLEDIGTSEEELASFARTTV